MYIQTPGNMNSAIGLLVIAALVVLLLFNTSGNLTQHTPLREAQIEPIYVYPISRDPNLWRIPAYSYGSFSQYRRFHAPRPKATYLPASGLAAGRIHNYEVKRPLRTVVPCAPSMIKRAGLTHPIRTHR